MSFLLTYIILFSNFTLNNNNIMNRKKFEDFSSEERVQMLRANCDNAEDIDYTKEFTEEEVREMETDLKDSTIEKLKLEEELTEVKQAIKLAIKPISKKLGTLVTNLRFGSRIVTEKCYKFIEGNRAVYYNSEGENVKDRPLLPEERQGKLFVTRNDDFQQASNF
jgi:hypothetical protein